MVHWCTYLSHTLWPPAMWDCKRFLHGRSHSAQKTLLLEEQRSSSHPWCLELHPLLSLNCFLRLYAAAAAQRESIPLLEFHGKQWPAVKWGDAMCFRRLFTSSFSDEMIKILGWLWLFVLFLSPCHNDSLVLVFFIHSAHYHLRWAPSKQAVKVSLDFRGKTALQLEWKQKCFHSLCH